MKKINLKSLKKLKALEENHFIDFINYKYTRELKVRTNKEKNAYDPDAYDPVDDGFDPTAWHILSETKPTKYKEEFENWLNSNFRKVCKKLKLKEGSFYYHKTTGTILKLDSSLIAYEEGHYNYHSLCFPSDLDFIPICTPTSFGGDFSLSEAKFIPLKSEHLIDALNRQKEVNFDNMRGTKKKKEKYYQRLIESIKNTDNCEKYLTRSDDTESCEYLISLPNQKLFGDW